MRPPGPKPGDLPLIYSKMKLTWGQESNLRPPG
jgi:hypothetical protein